MIRKQQHDASQLTLSNFGMSVLVSRYLVHITIIAAPNNRRCLEDFKNMQATLLLELRGKYASYWLVEPGFCPLPFMYVKDVLNQRGKKTWQLQCSVIKIRRPPRGGGGLVGSVVPNETKYEVV
jgi:hypothetical protein